MRNCRPQEVEGEFWVIWFGSVSVLGSW